MYAEFVERDDENIRIFRYKPETSVFLKTQKQDAVILDTLLFGRTLFLDGILQSAEKDEEIYHKILVHPVMDDSVKKVLILGGGEGATLREVVKWKEVEKIDMIDWDEELVTHFKNHEYGWHKGAFDDRRLTLEFVDVFTVMDQKREYDVIIVDLIDPDMADKKWQNLFKRLVGWLSKSGKIVINAGGVFPWDDGDIPLITASLLTAAEENGLVLEKMRVSRYKKWVPSFGREWGFVILKKFEDNC